MKLSAKKTYYFGLFLWLSLFCCYADNQEQSLKAKDFLEKLKKTDWAPSISGPNLPEDLYLTLSKLERSTQVTTINPEVAAWSSSGQKPRIFKDEKINIYFKELFYLIEKKFNDITLDRINLFHAHLVLTENDFILIFHAFEYPVDLEPQKFIMARRQNPGLKPFTTNLENFKRRNLIWSLSKNKIWRIDTSSKFNFLVKSSAFALYPKEVLRANSLQENLFGKRIADFNYFPSEDKNLFLNIQGL
jgi:hypothetical protein